jgi:hypothetical protein
MKNFGKKIIAITATLAFAFTINIGLSSAMDSDILDWFLFGQSNNSIDKYENYDISSGNGMVPSAPRPRDLDLDLASGNGMVPSAPRPRDLEPTLASGNGMVPSAPRPRDLDLIIASGNGMVPSAPRPRDLDLDRS